MRFAGLESRALQPVRDLQALPSVSIRRRQWVGNGAGCSTPGRFVTSTAQARAPSGPCGRRHVARHTRRRAVAMLERVSDSCEGTYDWRALRLIVPERRRTGCLQICTEYRVCPIHCQVQIGLQGPPSGGQLFSPIDHQLIAGRTIRGADVATCNLGPGSSTTEDASKRLLRLRSKKSSGEASLANLAGPKRKQTSRQTRCGGIISPHGPIDPPFAEQSCARASQVHKHTL